LLNVDGSANGHDTAPSSPRRRPFSGGVLDDQQAAMYVPHFRGKGDGDVIDRAVD